MTNVTDPRPWAVNGHKMPHSLPFPAPTLAPETDEHPETHRWGALGYALSGKARRKAGRRPSRVTLGGVLLTVASVFLVALAVGQGYVSFFQQYTFIDAAKHAALPSRLEALGLDFGAVVFALYAVALARLGRPARIERALNLACAIGSGIMNVLGADLASPRSVAVYLLPPLLYVAGSDRLISVLRRQALGRLEDEAAQRSLWAAFGRFTGRTVLYSLRLVLAPRSTVVGARIAVLQAAPVPEAPVKAVVITPAPARRPAVKPSPARKAITAGDGTKTGRFLALVISERGALDAIDPAAVSRICEELAPRVDLDKGAARKALRRAVLAAGDPR